MISDVKKAIIDALRLSQLKLNKYHHLYDLLDVLDKDPSEEFHDAAREIRSRMGRNENVNETVYIRAGLIYIGLFSAEEFDYDDSARITVSDK